MSALPLTKPSLPNRTATHVAVAQAVAGDARFPASDAVGLEDVVVVGTRFVQVVAVSPQEARVRVHQCFGRFEGRALSVCADGHHAPSTALGSAVDQEVFAQIRFLWLQAHGFGGAEAEHVLQP